MSENPKDSTTEKRGHNDWAESYVEFYTHKRVPAPRSLIIRLAEEMVAWAKNDKNALKVSQFYLEKGIPSSTFDSFVNRYPEFKAAKNEAILLIGNRREIGAIKNKYNSSMITRVQHRYDREWLTAEKELADVKAIAQAKGDKDVKYTVVLDSYADKHDDKVDDNEPKKP